MKEFIVDHHGESIFERDEKEAAAAKEETLQASVPEAKEEEVIVAPEVIPQEVVVPEVKEEEVVAPVKEEPKKEKVVVVIEQPVYNRYDSYYKGGYEKKKYGRSYKSSYRDRDDYYYGSKRVEEPVVVAEPEPVKEVKEEKYENPREKRMREEEMVPYRQLEKMVLELNEKLINSERRAKKMLDEKLEEVSKANEEKDQEFLQRIEKVEEEKKALLKRIDDMQWDRAYEYTEKMKQEKKEEVKVMDNKAGQTQAAASLNAKKKKNKK